MSRGHLEHHYALKCFILFLEIYTHITQISFTATLAINGTHDEPSMDIDTDQPSAMHLTHHGQ